MASSVQANASGKMRGEHQRTGEVHTHHAPQSNITGFIGEPHRLPGVVEVILGTVSEADPGITSVEGCERGDAVTCSP
jgi:hypothetical protein